MKKDFQLNALHYGIIIFMPAILFMVCFQNDKAKGISNRSGVHAVKKTVSDRHGKRKDRLHLDSDYGQYAFPSESQSGEPVLPSKTEESGVMHGSKSDENETTIDTMEFDRVLADRQVEIDTADFSHIHDQE